MKDKNMIAHEKLSERILSDFKSKITGENETRVHGNPEDAFFVGKLMSINDEDNNNSTYSSKTFIGSMGVDFYIDEEEISKASIQIYPQGDFYYRVYPSIDEQRKEFCKEVRKELGKDYESFDDLLKDYAIDNSAFSNIRIPLLPVYEKFSIEKTGYFFKIRLADLLGEDEYGGFNETDTRNSDFNEYLELKIKERFEESDNYRYEIKENIGIKDLIDSKTYGSFLNMNANTRVEVSLNWSLYIDLSVKKVKGRYLVSVSLVNNSSLPSGDRKKKKASVTVETLFNAGLRVQLNDAKFSDIELDYFSDDYKYDRTVKAIGTNCSVNYDAATESVLTDNLPTFIQHRYVTREDFSVRFDDLISDPVKVLRNIEKKMYVELEEWKKYKSKKEQELTEKGKKKIESEIAEFEQEIKRFVMGIEQIEKIPIVKMSFVLMNETFKNTSKKYSAWRLFQIVFIVSIIPDIVACDPNIMTDNEKRMTHLSEMALLFFPTGGGKTEAFLGVLVFNLFFDRYRGKKCGVTSILRYPLRLLSVQQVQRLANVLAQAEMLRLQNDDIRDSYEFSLGYYTGDGNTPNKISKKDALKYREKNQEQMDRERIIDICPFCGEKTVHLKFDEYSYRLIHFCDNADCPTKGKALPLYIVDNEIYRYLPSAIISTVDKLALMGSNRNFRALIDGADYKCPKHGFTTTGKCLVERDGCEEEADNFEKVDMYDPAPTLLIQDELHLINESLGAYASHYESYLHYYIRNMSRSHRGVKVIGATATISSYEEQVYHLYMEKAIRFPAASPYRDHDFYAYTDTEDIQRRIIGYSPYGKAIVNSVVYSMKYMREVVYKYLKDPSLVLGINGIGIEDEEEAKKIIEDYWIFLEYNNVKRDGNRVEAALHSPINDELRDEKVPEFITRKMTGDETFQDVRDVLAEVENTNDIFNGVNMIAATSMISHGVDADRFNNMFFYGIPGNVAEYIQAYSRTGRRYSSIVVDIMRPTRETDQSYLKNFQKFHDFKDIMVEPVAINRWAAKAIDSTLPGIFSAILLDHFDQILQNDTGMLFWMKNIKKGIQNDKIPKNEVYEMLCESYGCVTDTYDGDSMGNQYKKKISAFLDDVYAKIVDRNWIDANIFEGFDMMGYRIMNSLRDTDDPLIIEMTIDNPEDYNNRS